MSAIDQSLNICVAFGGTSAVATRRSSAASSLPFSDIGRTVGRPNTDDVGRSLRSAIKLVRSHDITCRARARSPRSAGNSRGCPGVGNVSARYSEIASDSVSHNSPWTSSGTLLWRPFVVASDFSGSGIGRGVATSSYASCFSSSAANAWNTHGLMKLESTYRVSSGAIAPEGTVR